MSERSDKIYVPRLRPSRGEGEIDSCGYLFTHFALGFVRITRRSSYASVAADQSRRIGSKAEYQRGLSNSL